MTTARDLHTQQRSVASPESNVFSIETRLSGTTVGVRVIGHLDLATVDELKAALTAYDDRARSYFFFLDSVHFVDVVGWKPIGSLCARGVGTIVSASPRVRRLMELMGMPTRIQAC